MICTIFVVSPGHCEAVRLLLSEGVPVDPIDHRGAPLHLALAKARVEVVKLLLEHGADVSLSIQFVCLLNEYYKLKWKKRLSVST